MNDFWELLFLAWCPPYDEKTMAPEDLRDDPVRAYGEYTFREGVRLGLQLAYGTFADEV